MIKFEGKVTKIDNSHGITFPQGLLKEAGITYGDKIRLELEDGKIILHKREEINLPDGVDNNFMNVLNDVIKEHDVAFKGLVDK